MQDTIIRPAQPTDAGAILVLIRALARFERAEDRVKATEADLLRDGWGPARRFEALVAEWRGSVVGFALFFTNYSTWEGQAGLFLEDLFVDPEARGLGLGRRLLAAVAATALARGCPRLDLNVLHWNPAREFYAKLGIEPLDEWLPYRAAGPTLSRLAAMR